MDGTRTAQHDPSTSQFLQARLDYHRARGHLLTELLPWLESLVSLAMRRLPPRARRDEALSEAVDELIGRLDEWDPARASLKTFAGRRVLGRIQDWARAKSLVDARHFSLDDVPVDFDR